MKAIRIIPYEHLDQPMLYCPECFGTMEKIRSSKPGGLYQCKECGQLYAHPEDVKEDGDNAIYLTVRAYFKYKHLKSFIMHLSYDMEKQRLNSYATCHVDDKNVNLQLDDKLLNNYLCYVLELFDTDCSSYRAVNSMETLHIVLNFNGRQRTVHGNFDLIEIIPGLDLLYNIIFSACHKAVKVATARGRLTIDVVD